MGGRRINTINDSKDSRTGSYYSGNWDEKSSSGEEPEQDGWNDEMSSNDENEKGGKQMREEGSLKGEGKVGKGRQ